MTQLQKKPDTCHQDFPGLLTASDVLISSASCFVCESGHIQNQGKKKKKWKTLHSFSVSAKVFLSFFQMMGTILHESILVS